MLRVICRLRGDESDAVTVDRAGEGGVKLRIGADTFRFDEVYEGGCSDESFFAAVGQPLVDAKRGLFVASGGDATAAFLARAAEAGPAVASAVEVRLEAAVDLCADGAALAGTAGVFVDAADARVAAAAAADAHKVVAIKSAEGATEIAVVALSSADDAKTSKGLAALGNVVAAARSGGDVPYRDSTLTRLLDGRLGAGPAVFCVYCDTAPPPPPADVARLKFASRLTARSRSSDPLSPDPVAAPAVAAPAGAAEKLRTEVASARADGANDEAVASAVPARRITRRVTVNYADDTFEDDDPAAAEPAAAPAAPEPAAPVVPLAATPARRITRRVTVAYADDFEVEDVEHPAGVAFNQSPGGDDEDDDDGIDDEVPKARRHKSVIYKTG